MPVRLTRPRVGLIPTTPQALDGETIDPSVSVPTARGAKPADRPAADPELDPDGLRSSAYGFAAWRPSVDQPLTERVDRKFAHSDRLALATMTAPAARSRETMNASGGLAPSSAGEPAVAGSPATWMLSLIRTGIPSRGPRAPRPPRGVARGRLVKGIRAHRDHGAQRGVHVGDAVQAVPGERRRGETGAGHRPVQPSHRGPLDVGARARNLGAWSGRALEIRHAGRITA